MKICFDEAGWSDYCYWSETDKKTLKKLQALIKDIMRSPHTGIGKPEPLKGDWSGFWSRRITGEHRIVYRVVGVAPNQTLEIAVCRYHYTR